MHRFYPFHEYAEYLSILSAHEIEYRGVRYKTAEHAYHCQRYGDPKIVDEIRNAPSVHEAWKISQKYKLEQDPDWDMKKLSVMEEICRAKLEQHPIVLQALIESADAVIIKDYSDPFWDIGPDGSGRNEMGKIWMRLRAKLRSGTKGV